MQSSPEESLPSSALSESGAADTITVGISDDFITKFTSDLTSDLTSVLISAFTSTLSVNRGARLSTLPSSDE